MKYLSCLSVFVMLCFSFSLKAQDTKLPHPYMWKSFNNPGYSGFDGLASVNIGMRRAYWSNPLDFRSYFLSADYSFKDKRGTLGLGGVSLFYQRDQEKSIMYVTNSISAAISARVKVGRRSVLQLGLQPFLHFKNLDQSRIVLGDQLDPYYGQILGLSPELVEFYSDNVTLFDVAAGIYGKSDFYAGKTGLSTLEYGFSIYHIIESTQSFLSRHGSVSSEENLLHRRYSAYLAYKHPFTINYNLHTILSPYFMIDMQSVMKNIHYGVYWEEERIGMIGLGVRNNQYDGFSVGTLLLSLGVNLRQSDQQGWKIGYTFEVPTTQGTMYKNTSHSLSVHWYFKVAPQRCGANFFDKSAYGKRTRNKRKIKL
ncbi:PorP/SprF family type IX secretion system membrane protein [Odoribacter sp. OttesenSCG-928-G04]|nr:PorP/SprF family type IX secretion system membrane protein [Odoribacter sp. OttesenSCG-928-G04]MDL2330490.1 PorP/SprF family type IX secretion system membrane protein [Odoribacter sp. OttesenSCG-928-A06]